MAPPVGAHDSKSFWDAFGAVSSAPSTPPAGVHGRGLFRKLAADAGAIPDAAPGRTVDYYHYYTDKKTKQTTLRLATSIDANELMDHEGDITASVNVNGFRMAGDDRATFDQLQSHSCVLIWCRTSRCCRTIWIRWRGCRWQGCFPISRASCLRFRDLSFDPSSAAAGKMKQMVLPVRVRPGGGSISP